MTSGQEKSSKKSSKCSRAHLARRNKKKNPRNKALAAVLIAALALALMASCGGASFSIPSRMIGTYEGDAGTIRISSNDIVYEPTGGSYRHRLQEYLRYGIQPVRDIQHRHVFRVLHEKHAECRILVHALRRYADHEDIIDDHQHDNIHQGQLISQATSSDPAPAGLLYQLSGYLTYRQMMVIIQTGRVLQQAASPS